MATDHVKTSVEDERREIVNDLATEHGPDWGARYAPGTFGCHELLDRLSLVARLLDEAIVSHPACVQKPEWYALARRASDAVNDLYQEVGAEHL